MGLGRHPHLGIEYQGGRILDHPAGIGRDAVAGAPRPMHLQAVQLSVPQGAGRQFEGPDPPVIDSPECKIRSLLPAGGLADKKDGGGPGRPLAQDPALGLDMQSEIAVLAGCRGEVFTGRGQPFEGVSDRVQAVRDAVGIGGQQAIVGHQLRRQCRRLSGIGGRWTSPVDGSAVGGEKHCPSFPRDRRPSGAPAAD